MAFTALPKLAYFDIEGRAFATRVALRAAKFAYEDVRVKFPQLAEMRGKEGWSAAVPLGQLPVLELGGHVYAQSGSLARWAGRLAGLYPEDPLEALRVDMVMETANECQTKIGALQHSDPAEKKRLREDFANTQLERYLAFLEANIQGPFILGDRLTVGDVYAQVALNMILTGNADHISPDLVAKAHPKLLAFRDAVRAHPLVKVRSRVCGCGGGMP